MIFSKKSKNWFLWKNRFFLKVWVAQTTYTPVILGGEHDADIILMIWKKFCVQNLEK